jgi:hypothetical protein
MTLDKLRRTGVSAFRDLKIKDDQVVIGKGHHHQSFSLIQAGCEDGHTILW